MAAWKVAVDRDSCLGTGICVVYAPDTFAHDEEAKAVVVGPPEPLDTVRTAVEGVRRGPCAGRTTQPNHP